MNMNPVIQMLMQRLQGKNPQGYQFVNTAMRNGGDPNTILNQMMKNSTPEQKQGLINMAKQYGVPENILKQIQNMK